MPIEVRLSNEIENSEVENIVVDNIVAVPLVE